MTAELPGATHEAIRRLSAEGDALARGKKHDEALQKYREAFDLLPDPKYRWEASAWLLAAMGDAYFFSGRFAQSLETFSLALLNVAGAQENPFLHLRRGESLFELDRKKDAADELMRAYMLAGAKIFSTEDPKYLTYLKTVARID